MSIPQPPPSAGNEASNLPSDPPTHHPLTRSQSEFLASHRSGLASLSSLNHNLRSSPPLSRRSSHANNRQTSDRGSVSGRESIVSAGSAFGSRGNLGLGLALGSSVHQPIWATLARQMSADAALYRGVGGRGSGGDLRAAVGTSQYQEVVRPPTSDNVLRVESPKQEEEEDKEEYPDPDDDDPRDNNHIPLTVSVPTPPRVLTRSMLASQSQSQGEISEPMDEERSARVKDWIGEVQTLTGVGVRGDADAVAGIIPRSATSNGTRSKQLPPQIPKPSTLPPPPQSPQHASDHEQSRHLLHEIDQLRREVQAAEEDSPLLGGPKRVKGGGWAWKRVFCGCF